MPYGAIITGTGSALPEKRLTNDDLSKIVDTNDEWITQRTGIKERRIAGEGDTTASLASAASKKAIEAAGISPKEIELIVVATITPEMVFPSTGCFVGNIVLKFTEGMAEGLFQTIVSEIQEADPELLERLGPVMKKLHAKHDWREYGGAPLLGVNGYCLICHGRSDAKAIRNAIRVGKQLHASGVNAKIVDTVGKAVPAEQAQ